MAIVPQLPRFVGARVRRREDPRLITGQGTFVADVPLVGALHLAVLRSPHAHARIVSIDADAARQASGVVAVVAGAEVKDFCSQLPFTSPFGNNKPPKRWPLATEVARFVGDPVAAVVAESRAAAEDALDLIHVEYEPRPSVIDPEQAARKDSPTVYEGMADNVAFVIPAGSGDVEGAFRAADRIVRARIVNHRVAPLPIEPRCIAAEFRGNPGELTVWSATQSPHVARTHLANLLGIPENRVRVIAPDVGGGFGAKGEFWPEDLLVASFAMKLRRPVRWTADRREDFAGMTHGRGQIDEVELAVTGEGVILGMKLRILADLGAYFQSGTFLVPQLTAQMGAGPYRIPAVATQIVGVLTNKVPTAPYRGAGRPEASFLLERMIDVVAHDLGLDPAEVRRKNLLPPEAFPYKTPTGSVYDSGNYLPALEKALTLADYAGFRREQAEARARGRLIGVGLSFYVEMCGVGPSRVTHGMGWEATEVIVEKSGKVTVLTGISPHGQGEETTFAQIVADELGVGIDDVEVVHGDTARVPLGGMGTVGSRGLAVGGGALVMSVEKVREKARQLAAHLLEVAPEDVVFANGKFGVKGVPDRALGIVEIARAAYDAQNLPSGMEPGLAARSLFEPTNLTAPFGCHVCQVEVDPATGGVTILRYVAVDDCGNIISPMLVEGQVHGGIAQGVAQALREEVVYDPETGQLLTASLLDYAVPTAGDLPSFELAHTVTPTTVNPLGAKGVGEAGTIGSTPAVANAVIDALRLRHADMPFTPERVWRLVQEGN